MAGQAPRAEAEQATADNSRPSYVVRNPWRLWSSGAFAGGSTILTVTTLFYALGRLPLALVLVSVVLAALSFGFGFYARRRADRFDAQFVSAPR